MLLGNRPLKKISVYQIQYVNRRVHERQVQKKEQPLGTVIQESIHEREFPLRQGNNPSRIPSIKNHFQIAYVVRFENFTPQKICCSPSLVISDQVCFVYDYQCQMVIKTIFHFSQEDITLNVEGAIQAHYRALHILDDLGFAVTQ